jgi:serine/threonine protein kinase
MMKNIFINENNLEIKIADFGVSKLLEAKSNAGNFKYSAPEIIKEEEYDNKADIY